MDMVDMDWFGPPGSGSLFEMLILVQEPGNWPKLTFQNGFCTYIAIFYDILPMSKILRLATAKSDQDPDLHWFAPLDPDPDPHWNPCGPVTIYINKSSHMIRPAVIKNQLIVSHDQTSCNQNQLIISRDQTRSNQNLFCLTWSHHPFDLLTSVMCIWSSSYRDILDTKNYGI